jgi:hypothetical protein
MAVVLMSSVTAFGYNQSNEEALTVSAPDPVACGAKVEVTAKILDSAGKPVVGQSVVWSFVGTVGSDTINTTPTVTDAKGVATTTVTFGLSGGARHIRATSGAFSATAVVTPACSGGVLPNTSTLPGDAPSRDAPLGAFAIAALALVFVGGLGIRRLASAQR